MFVTAKLKYFQRNSLLMWANGYLYGETFKNYKHANQINLPQVSFMFVWF